jgi:Bacterial aa3 type cytochrome c oxidase subunit IV
MEAKLGEQQDITAAKETYAGFMSLLKWGTVATVIVTALVVLIIASRAA